ncbi:MAG TPA: Gfo/Idh/MocA family oxidoreductase, partial [Clostridiaceae bacterium]|nr:Gfo/Idh/MocA family oxidoreductase [Clostridiaceae bacterium]
MIRIGLVGAGRMGKVHYDAYKSIPDVKVVAAADVDIENARKRLNDPEVVFYDNVDLMLEKEN